MNARAFGLLLFAAALAFAPLAHAALEFSGYISANDGLRFVVTDLDMQKTSGWLRMGDAFQEHKVVGFDARSETLTVEHQGTSLRLLLKGARIVEASPAPEKKPEINLAVSATGGLSLEGRPQTDEEFRAALRRLAEAAQPFTLLIHEPPNPNAASSQGTKKILEAVRDSGAKKWSIRIVDAPPQK